MPYVQQKMQQDLAKHEKYYTQAGDSMIEMKVHISTDL